MCLGVMVPTQHNVYGHLHPSAQDDVDRLKRLVKAEKEVHVEDEMVGGQQENVILSLQREVNMMAVDIIHCVPHCHGGGCDPCPKPMLLILIVWPALLPCQCAKKRLQLLGTELASMCILLHLVWQEREKEKLRAKQLASLREAEGRSTGTSTGASTGAPGSSTGADGHERKDAK